MRVPVCEMMEGEIFSHTLKTISSWFLIHLYIEVYFALSHNGEKGLWNEDECSALLFHSKKISQSVTWRRVILLHINSMQNYKIRFICVHIEFFLGEWREV